MRKIGLVALLAVLLAAPAFAEVQNVKLSGSLNIVGLHRDNFDLSKESSNRDRGQDVFISQTTLDVNADLTDQVSATVGLINERVWGDSSPSTSDGVDLYLAYVTLREFLYSPLTIVAGKQAFHYGNSLIVDSAGANNSAPASSGLDSVAEDLTAQTTQDAIRAIFDYNPLVLELLWSKIAEEDANTDTTTNINDDHDLYGINATYNFGDEHNTQVEAYFFADIDQDNGANVPSGGGVVDSKIYVPGIRASVNAIDAVNLQAEVAHQFGQDTADLDRDAWAFQGIATWAIPGDKVGMEGMKPTLQYVYTFTTGDDDSTDDENNAWNQLYENQGGGTIYNTLFNLTDSHIHVVSLSASPVEDVTAKVSWTGLWLAEKLPTTTALPLYQPDGGSLTPTVSTDDTNLGHEVDVDVSYAYTEDVKFGASLGWFFPGDVFDNANDTTASQALVNAKVNF